MSFCTLTLAYVCVSSVFDPVPNYTEQNSPFIDHCPYHQIELFTAFKSHGVHSYTQILTGVPSVLELVAMVS